MAVPRSYFPAARWLWDRVPDDPVLHEHSATWAGYMGEPGKQHNALMHDFGVTIVPRTAVVPSTPRYRVEFAMVPDWGPHPYGTATVPIPDGTVHPPMDIEWPDSHLVVDDPTTGLVYGIWQAERHPGPPVTWTGSFGGLCNRCGDGRDVRGSATATNISRLAGVVRAADLAAAAAAGTGLPHALFASCDATSDEFVYPASKADGTNAAGKPVPIPQGTRFQLDPALDVGSLPSATPAEKVIARTLQTHGVYIGDRGGSRLAVLFEFQKDGNPGAAYTALGLAWDYYDMNAIPWGSLRALKKWNGAA